MPLLPVFQLPLHDGPPAGFNYVETKSKASSKSGATKSTAFRRGTAERDSFGKVPTCIVRGRQGGINRCHIVRQTEDHIVSI